MYFTTKPALMSIEREMQQTPNFPPRGGGKYYSRFRYKKTDCDCRRCLHFKSKTGCTQALCPFLDIRLECGAANINEAVIAVFGQARYTPLRNRIKSIYKGKNADIMTFKDQTHKTIFESERMQRKNLSNRTLAVLYLLTADNKLRNCTKHHIDRNGKVDFDKVRVQELSTNAYALWKAVRELQIGGEEITLRELADAELISDNAFRLIVQAVTIAHYGEVALTESEVSR